MRLAKRGLKGGSRGHVPGTFSALHTCRADRSESVPARSRQAFRVSYVPGRRQRIRPGTYQASFPRFIRARQAAAHPSRHVPGKLSASLTCP